MIQMNFFAEQKQTNQFEKLMVTKGDRLGVGGLNWGLAYAHGGIWNNWRMGTCCIAQKTLPSIL